MQLFRPPVGMLTAEQIVAVEWAMGWSSGLSVVASFLVIAYVATKLFLQRFRRRPSVTVTGHPSSGSEDYLTTDFMIGTRKQTTGAAQDAEVWLLLWFSELSVLCLMVADLGSALWYFLQLHVLGVGCSDALAFFGTVFEPTSVLVVTAISLSMLVLLRGSLKLQTRSAMKKTLIVLLVLCFVVAWVLPLILATVFLLEGQYGQDAVYCWLSPVHASTRLRLYVYYLPILFLLVMNILTSLAVVYVNRSQHMGLSNFALLWVPLGLLLVWTVPTISTTWANVSSQTVPFPVVLMSATLLPTQGLFNAVFFAIVLGREKKIVQETITEIASEVDDGGEGDAFATDEVKLRVFGQTIVWYFVN